MLPLDFRQLIQWIHPELLQLSEQELWLRHFPKIQKLFEDYLLTGGFPSVINQFYRYGQIDSYLYELYLNWIEGDLHRFRRSSKSALTLAELMNKHLGSSFSYNKIAREAGLSSHATFMDYLNLLERMFVGFSLDCFVIEQKKPEFNKNKRNV